MADAASVLIRVIKSSVLPKVKKDIRNIYDAVKQNF